jgi:hypothetical protein
LGVWGIWIAAGLTWFISGFFALVRYITKMRSAAFISAASPVRTQPIMSHAKVTAIRKAS